MSSINNDITQLKKIILDTAIRGKLVPQDENDEDAGVLLEKIKAEKEKLIKDGKIKKGKPLSDIKPEEIPFDIPNSWRWVRLGEVLSIIRGVSYKKGEDHLVKNEGDIVLLRGQNMQEGKLILENVIYISKGLVSDNQFVSKGEIVVTLSSGSKHLVGKTAFVDQDGEFTIGAFYAKFLLNRALNNKYIFTYTLSDLYKEGIFKDARGTNINNLTNSRLNELLFPLPSLAEQQRIVAKIESLFKLADEIDSRRISLVEKVKQLKSAILQEAITGKLVPQDESDEDAGILLEKIKEEKEKLIKEGKIKEDKPLPEIKPDEIPFEIPTSWRWVRLGQVSLRTGSGSTPRGGKNVYTEVGVPFLRSQNIYNDGIRESGLALISKEISDKMNYTSLQINDLLLNITGGSIGRCAICTDRHVGGNLSQHVTLIRPSSKISSKYIHKVILSDYFQKEIYNYTTGSGRIGLQKYKMDAMFIPLPPYPEQIRIVAKVDQFNSFINQLEQKQNQSKELASNLNEAILNETVES